MGLWQGTTYTLFYWANGSPELKTLEYEGSAVTYRDVRANQYSTSCWRFRPKRGNSQPLWSSLCTPAKSLIHHCHQQTLIPKDQLWRVEGTGWEGGRDEWKNWQVDKWGKNQEQCRGRRAAKRTKAGTEIKRWWHTKEKRKGSYVMDIKVALIMNQITELK